MNGHGLRDVKITIIATKSLIKFRKSVYYGRNKIRKLLKICLYTSETIKLEVIRSNNPGEK